MMNKTIGLDARSPELHPRLRYKPPDCERERVMDCIRCQGLMIPVRLEEGVDARSGASFAGWRCLLCGEVIDSLIIINRKGNDAPVRRRGRPRFYVQTTGSSGFKHETGGRGDSGY